MRGTIAIVGVGESPYCRPGAAPETEFQLAVIAIKNAAEDAGLRVDDIDGFVSYTGDRNTPGRLATALGVKEGRWSASGRIGRSRSRLSRPQEGRQRIRC